MVKSVAVFGASGAIGSAIVEGLTRRFPLANIFASTRSEFPPSQNALRNRVVHMAGVDITAEQSVEAACAASVQLDQGPPDLVFVTTGVLHGEDFAPERRMQDLDPSAFVKVLEANLVGPSLVIKHMMAHLPRKHLVRMGVLSARVGSISDNRLGGWYSYRASKAGLNMVVKSASIEWERRNKEAVLVGLHPGTVDSTLSSPFQSGVPEGKLFSPAQAAGYLIETLLTRTPDQSGKCFDWAGEEILP